MATATQLTVNDAAKHVGVTRQTIFKAIKAGKLSATTNHQGHKQINVSELLRVYGRLLSPDEVAQKVVDRAHQSSPELATMTLQLELERAKMQLERKDFELEQMRIRVDELKQRERETTDERLRLFGIIERQTLLLAAPKPARPKAAAKPKPPAAVVKQAPAKTAARTPAKPVAKTPARSKPAPKTAAKKATRK